MAKKEFTLRIMYALPDQVYTLDIPFRTRREAADVESDLWNAIDYKSHLLIPLKRGASIRISTQNILLMEVK